MEVNKTRTVLDVLVIAAHPDDAELCAGGTILRLKAEELKLGVLDLTRGELGTRGTPETRAAEAAIATQLLGLDARENLGLPDGFFQNNELSQRAVIQALRHYRPQIVIANAPSDRHPDHGRAALLAREACFLAGLKQILTHRDGQPQEAWRPARVIHYIQDEYLIPSFVFDVSAFFEQKLQVLAQFKSQFFDPESKEPETHISKANYMDFIRSRARNMGHYIGVEYGEGYIHHGPMKVADLLRLI